MSSLINLCQWNLKKEFKKYYKYLKRHKNV